MQGFCQGLNKFRSKKWKKLQNFSKLTSLEIYPTLVNGELYTAFNITIKAKCMVTPPLSIQGTLQSNLLLNCSTISTQKTVLLNQFKNIQSFKFNKKKPNLFPSRKKKSGRKTNKAAWRNLLKTRKNTFLNLLQNRQVRKKKESQLSKTLEKRRKNRPKTISRDRLNIILNKTVKVFWAKSSPWSDWLLRTVMIFQNWQTISKKRGTGHSSIGNSNQACKSFIECLKRSHLCNLSI